MRRRLGVMLVLIEEISLAFESVRRLEAAVDGARLVALLSRLSIESRRCLAASAVWTDTVCSRHSRWMIRFLLARVIEFRCAANQLLRVGFRRDKEQDQSVGYTCDSSSDLVHSREHPTLSNELFGHSRPLRVVFEEL